MSSSMNAAHAQLGEVETSAAAGPSKASALAPNWETSKENVLPVKSGRSARGLGEGKPLGRHITHNIDTHTQTHHQRINTHTTQTH